MVTMADTGLLAAPATAASARHSKVRTPPPPLGAYSSADECTDSEAETDHRAREEDDGDGERGRRPQAQQPMCLTGRSNTNCAANNNNNVNNVINNNNNNNGGGGNSTRNKRKNFQPRNISYTQEDEAAAADGLEDDRRGDGGSGTGAGGDASGGDQSTASVAAAAAAGAVLDLSGPYTGGSTVAKRPRVDDGSAPMDLTCAVSAPPPPPPAALLLPHADKRQAPATVHGVQHLLQVAAAAAAAAGGGGHHLQGVLHHHRPHQPADPSSDLKEYAQNTVRELLEIYGLNTDVADAITNNVPMVNFSTGKCRIDSIFC